MEQKTWLKPAEGGKIFKSDFFKSLAEKEEETVLIECLYLDTAETALLENGMALMLCSGPDGISQMALMENDDATVSEYAAPLPLAGLDIALFPEDAAEKLRAVIQDKPLLIHLVSMFEEKTRRISAENGGQYVLAQIRGYFEDDDLKELCTLELRSAQSDTDEYAQTLMAQAGLERCAPPWFEIMRVKTTGFHPAAKKNKLKKYAGTKIAQLLSFRIFELLRAYIALSTGAFERLAVHKLRIEARKMMSVMEAFEALLGEKAAGHIAFLNTLLDDTDEVRRIDLLEDELDMMHALNPNMDIAEMRQKMTADRAGLIGQIKTACQSGVYAAGLIGLWTDVHRWGKQATDEEAGVASALAHIKEWTATINAYKKSDLSDPENIQAYRVLLRKIRYALDNMEEMVPGRANKASAGLKKIQDEFGMLHDIDQHMETLHRMAVASSDMEFAYNCGVCYGVFSGCLQDIRKDTLGTWKDYRQDLKALEEAL